MMRGEFEELAGIRAGYLFYSKMIEPMYNALPEFIDKQDFVKSIDARKAQAFFYDAMISRGSIGLLNEDTTRTLFSDLKYIEVIDKTFQNEFVYCDTDNLKACLNRRYGRAISDCYKGGYTHTEPMREED